MSAVQLHQSADDFLEDDGGPPRRHSSELTESLLKKAPPGAGGEDTEERNGGNTTSYDQEDDFGEGEKKVQEMIKVYDKCWWRFTHASAFTLGGATFVIGTTLLFPPNTDLKSIWSAVLYIVGSMGFLYVDVQEFFTFTDDPWLRLNILLSVIGSTFYVVCSTGFLPSVYAWSDGVMGNSGFVLGSFFIGSSQIWKLVRIHREEEANRDDAVDSDDTGGVRRRGGICFCCGYSGCSPDALSSVCVEGGACLGGWCFFFGDLWYWLGREDDEHDVRLYDDVMVIWVFGSIFFTLGGLSLAYRHFILGLV